MMLHNSTSSSNRSVDATYPQYVPVIFCRTMAAWLGG